MVRFYWSALSHPLLTYNVGQVGRSSASRGTSNDGDKVPGTFHVTGKLDVVTLDVVTEHVNRYLHYYRLLPWALGAVGVALFLRHTGIPLRRFRKVSDIPHDLIRNNQRLSGVVKATGWETIGV